MKEGSEKCANRHRLLLIFFSRSKYNFGVTSSDSDSEQPASTATRITRSPSVASSASAATVGRGTSSARSYPDLQLTPPPPNQVNTPVVSDLTESDQNVSGQVAGLLMILYVLTFKVAECKESVRSRCRIHIFCLPHGRPNDCGRQL